MNCPHTWFSTELKGGKRLVRARLRDLLRPATRRGRGLALLAAVLTLCAGVLVACQSGSDTATAHIVMDTQYYDDRGNVLEIPQIAGDDSPDAQAINDALLARKAQYQSYMDAPFQSGTWCEVAAFPVTTERYLNLALLENVYPCYGTDGDLYAWVYDRQEGRSVTVEEALDLAGTTEDALRDALAEDLAAGEPSLPLDEDSFSIRGFCIGEGGDVTFYLQGANLDGAQGMDPWLGLYAWNGGTLRRFQETYSTEVDTFVPAASVDVMDPPLWCQWRALGAPADGFTATRPLALWTPTAAYLGLDPASLESALYDAALNLRTSQSGSADLCLPRVTVVGSYEAGNATHYLCTLHRTYYYDFLLLRGANIGGGADCAVFTVEAAGDGFAVTDAVDGGDGMSPGAFYRSQGAPADLCARLDAAYETEGMPILLQTPSAGKLLQIYLSRCFFAPVTAENRNMEAAAQTFVDGLPGTAPGEALTAAFGADVWERLSLSFTQTRSAALRTANLDPDTGEETPDGTPVCVTDGDEWRVDLTVDGVPAGHFSVTNAAGPWKLSRGLVLDI